MVGEKMSSKELTGRGVGLSDGRGREEESLTEERTRSKKPLVESLFFNGLWSPLTFLAWQWLSWKCCRKIESYFFPDLNILFLSKLAGWKNF